MSPLIAVLRQHCLRLSATAAMLVVTALPVAAADIAFGLRPIAPLVVQQADGSMSGLEYEILAAALNAAGHRLVPRLGQNFRLASGIYQGSLDAMAPHIGEPLPGVTLSEPYITYHNVALSLSARGLTVGTAADLRAFRVIAFQRATLVLGERFQAAVTGSRLYREEAQQEVQVQALVDGIADVIIGDRLIFRHHLDRIAAVSGEPIPVTEHALFPPTRYRAAFRDPAMAADFNRGLATIRANGTLAALLTKYGGGN